MSTRGYVTIIGSDKNIVAAAFQPSDAYPSYFGLQVLDAISKDRVFDFISQLHEDYPHEKVTVEGIRRDWYIKQEYNKDDYFYDYAYEYELSSNKLSVFNYGDKVMTIPFDQISLYRYIFENEDDLYFPLCLDDKTMTLKKDFYKELRKLVKDGADEAYFKAFIEANPSVLYMDKYRMKDHTMQYKNDRSFCKEISDSKDHSRLKIIAEDYGHMFLYVQTPFCRYPIDTPHLSGPSSVEKYLAKLIKTRPDDIRGTISLYKSINDYLQNLNKVFDDKSTSLEEKKEKGSQLRYDMHTKFDSKVASFNPIGCPASYLIKEINFAFTERYRREKERLDSLEKKPSLSEIIDLAKDRSDTGKSPVEIQQKECR